MRLPPRRGFLLCALVLLGIAFGALFFRFYRSRSLEALQARVVALRAERDGLVEHFNSVALRKDPLGLARAPNAGIVVGIPTSVQQDLLRTAVKEVLGQVRIRLLHLQVHHDEELTAHILFADRSLAHFFLDLDLAELGGTVRLGDPTFGFSKNRITVDVPASLLEGSGHGNLHFLWGAKGLSDLVCGSLDVNRPISGRVLPSEHRFQGGISFSTTGDFVVATPELKDPVLRLRIEPSEETWAMVRAVVASVARDTNAVCDMALRKADVPQKLREVLSQGLDARLPERLFRPFRVPVDVEQQIQIQGKTIHLAARPLTIALDADMLWLGAGVGVSSP